MHLRAVFHLISYTLGVIGLAMLVSGLVGRFYGDAAPVVWQIIGAGGITVACAGALCFFTRGKIVLSRPQ